MAVANSCLCSNSGGERERDGGGPSCCIVTQVPLSYYPSQNTPLTCCAALQSLLNFESSFFYCVIQNKRNLQFLLLVNLP